jgi:peroxiredoxin
VPASILLIALLSSNAAVIREAERQRAPAFELKDADGNLVRLADYKGKVVLINFWATWCVPCKEEIPWFIGFERDLKEHGFVVVGISLDETGWTAALPYMRKMGINYQVVLGDSRTAYRYGKLDSLPVTFLVDRQGRVASIQFGLVSKKKVEEDIRKLLQDDPPL